MDDQRALSRWPRTALAERLGLKLPILQAPMASIATAPLVAAVSGAGALGCLGSATMTPAEVEAEVQAVRAVNGDEVPFALNFFVHRAPRVDEWEAAWMRRRIEPYQRELGAEPGPLSVAPPFDGEMLERVLALRPPVVSFHFGLPAGEALAALRGAGVKLLATATTATEARQLQAAGVDAIIAQGAEAGGHRGTFASSYSEGQIGTMALVPQIVDAVSLPVIAAGGIADGRGIAAALMLGASAVQLGTAFLGCPEAKLDPLYRRTLLEPRAAHTRITTVMTGRPARAIVTRFIDEMAAEEGRTLEFPLQRALTVPLGKAGAARGTPEFLPMWSGQAAPLLRQLPAAELVAALARETERALAC
jgi:nitronate monooxygenase